MIRLIFVELDISNRYCEKWLNGAGGHTLGSQSPEGRLGCCESVFNWKYFLSILKDFLSMVFFMVFSICLKISY